MQKMENMKNMKKRTSQILRVYRTQLMFSWIQTVAVEKNTPKIQTKKVSILLVLGRLLGGEKGAKLMFFCAYKKRGFLL